MRTIAPIALAVACVSALVLAPPSHANNSKESSSNIPIEELVADQDTRRNAQKILDTVDASNAPQIALDEDSQILQLGLPQLGGLWIDDGNEGAIVSIGVVAATESDISAEAEVILQKIRSVKQSEVSSIPAAVALRDGSAQIQLVPVAYSFAQLKEWQAKFDPLFSEGLLTMSDADERNNTVTLGVSDKANTEKILRYGIHAGVPAPAMKVVEATFSVSLRDDDRPLAGGQQIEHAIPIIGPVGVMFYTSICSLGMPTMIANTSPQVTGYITNSHCSIDYADVDYVYHWQPSIPLGSLFFTGNRIGYEVLDPPLFTGNPYNNASYTCPSGFNCRLSDVSFGLFDGDYTTTPRGSIARPSTTGTTTWNGTDRYRVTAIATPSGSVRKVGRTTGMSTGTITHTCFKTTVADFPGVQQLCSYAGSYASDHGDSGGPVFKVTNSPSTNDVTFVGLNWGMGTIDNQAVGVLSSWSLTLVDFSPYDIRVCDASFSC